MFHYLMKHIGDTCGSSVKWIQQDKLHASFLWKNSGSISSSISYWQILFLTVFSTQVKIKQRQNKMKTTILKRKKL